VHRLVVTIALAVLGLGGCNSAAPSNPAPASTTLASIAVSPAELASWIRFRLVYGLRSDAEWALRVANDPNAVGQEFSVPLLPDEFDRVTQDSLTAESLYTPARRYGEQFDTFAGAWLELPHMVIAFTDGLTERRTEASSLFGDRVIVKQARYSVFELKGFEDLVQAQSDWLETIDVRAIDIGLDESDNNVLLNYEAPNQAVEARIRERLGRPDWLRFDWAGPPPYTGPSGRLELTVVDEDGRPIPVSMTLRPRDPRVVAFGPAPLDDGTFIIPTWPAVVWEAEIRYTVDGVDRVVSKEFSVPADGVARVRIVVP
jgi:hypothetical protein